MPGPYGDALTGGIAQSPYQANVVDTGWSPAVTGDYTWAMLTRAAFPAEISAWATMNIAGASDFGLGCDAGLTSSNGAPVIGNLGYGLEVSSQSPGSLGFLTLGFSRTSAGALSLPVDLGTFLPALAGCPWECSADVSTLVILNAQGGGTLPFPPVAAYDGVQFYNQGLFIGGPLGVMSTNPVGMVLGN